LASIKHDSAFVVKILQDFPEREREICQMRLGIKDGIEYTLEEIGQRFDLTRERVRQLEDKTLRKLYMIFWGLGNSRKPA